MKKFLSLLLSAFLLFASSDTYAANSYVHIMPLAFSSYLPGEDIVIRCETDCSFLVLGLYYPDEGENNGRAKYITGITAAELRAGFTIPTDPLWEEGNWRVVVQNGSARDEVFINLSKHPSYSRTLSFALYDGDFLSSVATFPTRGSYIKNGATVFSVSDSISLKLFFWDDALSPVQDGGGSLYAAFYEDDILLSAGRFEADDISLEPCIVLERGNSELKIFYWSENLTPLPIN